MPVNNTSSLAGPFTPNGVTTVFPFAFNAALTSDVAVFDGEGAQVPSALYTVALYEGDGGTVTFSTAPSAATYAQLYIALVPSFAQTADFTNAGPVYNPVQLTAALDAIATRIIAVKGSADRALKMPLGVDGLEVDEIAEGQVLARVGGKLTGIDESSSASAVAAATSAAIAQAITGPLYGSIAAGLAATSDTDEFAVDNGDGTATIYLNNAGSEVERRTIVIDPANAGTAALLGVSGSGTVQSVIDETITRADVTLYVNASTGNDSTGTGAVGAPFATPQKAVDTAALLTGRKSVLIEVAAGTYSTSSRAAASMDRPALIYIDGLKIGKRTAQSGSTLSGGLVINFASGAKVTPNTTYPRGIYVTGHAGSVGIVGGEVEAATGAESLIVAHRGAYVHVRGTVADGNSISGLGLVSEAGGYMECVDVTASGSTADAVCYMGSVLQMAAPAGTATVGTITNTGHFDLAVGMEVTGTITNRSRLTLTGTSGDPILLGGGYDGTGGTVYGSNVRMTASAASVIAKGETWSVDALHSNAKLNFRACNVTLNAFQSYISPATQSTHAQPIALLEDSKISYSATIDNVNSSGALIGPDLSTQTVTISGDGQTITPQIVSDHHVIRLNNTKGSLATGCILSLDSGWKSGQRVANGQLLTIVNLGGNGVQIIDSTTVTGQNASSHIIGATAGQYRAVTFVYLTDYGKWMPIGTPEITRLTAPSATYAAPATTAVATSGGSVIDVEARAAIAQLIADRNATNAALAALAADHADLKAKTQAARIHA